MFSEKSFPVFVSGRQKKLLEYQLLVDWRLPWKKIDLDEVQSMDVSKIVSKKAVDAFNIIRKPVWVEDTGLYINAWNGLPGPLIKWFLASIGQEGICEMCKDYNDHRASAITAIGFCNEHGVKIFKGETEGIIPLSPRGSLGFGWDSIFQPDSDKNTFGEMSREKKNMFSMRAKAFRKFLNYLQGGGNFE